MAPSIALDSFPGLVLGGGPLFMGGVKATAIVITVRGFWFVGAFLASRRLTSASKIAAVLAYTCIAHIAARYTDFDPLRLMFAYAYLCASSSLIYFLPRIASAKLYLFIATSAMTLVIPALLLPQPTRFFSVLLGWELLMKGYSYCVDSRRSESSFGDYFFFLFVNPVLRYREMGHFEHGPIEPHGVVRFFRGAALVFVSVALSAAILPPVQGHSTSASIAYACVHMVGLYSAHAGLAGLQIGLMACLGWRVPERYVRPFVARSPSDFWRRWNTYVNRWVRAYIFSPLAVWASRRWSQRLNESFGKGIGRQMLAAVATMVTFLFVGVLHDAYIVCDTHQFSFWGMCWFGVNGVVVVGWDLITRLLRGGHPSGAGIAAARTTALIGVAIALTMAIH